MGRCLNLANSDAIAQAKSAYDDLLGLSQRNNTILPRNTAFFKARFLDCLVLNWLHDLREQNGEPPYDTVRGLFLEGSEIYPGAGILEANHIQICVRDTRAILGYFRPIALD